MKATLDRFENGFAVLLIRNDESVKIDMPRVLLPEGCKEGDILDISINKDIESTEAAREKVSNLIEKLKKKRDVGI